MSSNFRVIAQDASCYARIGELKTAHGIIETPVFMPVATAAVFKGGIDGGDAYATDAPIILANTYHLYMRGVVDVIKKAGGIHKFMGWDKPILTDSGGFQVWSLGLGARKKRLCSIDRDGVTFASHIDGKKYRLTPEDAVSIQHDLGADIIMAFDEATADGVDYAYTKEAMERTHTWAKRCLIEHAKYKKQRHRSPLLFGIIQGGRFKKLRKQSANAISKMPFDGVAIGGESIGYNMKRTADLLDYLAPCIERERPLYTMGVGFSPTDFFTVVSRGADMFDCVAPSRIARHGSLYTRSDQKGNNYRLNILNAQYTYDFRPICDWCDCSVCAKYSRAYIRHLFKAKELTALRLATLHNLRFMLKVMEEIRAAIKAGQFARLKKEWM